MKELDEYLTTCGQMPFQWGTHDCVLFASRWVELYSGFSPLGAFPPWDSEYSALKILRKEGGLEACVSSVLGEPLKTSPKDGDIGLLPDKLGGLCIVYGAYVVSPSKPVGLGFHPFTDAQVFWRLPCQIVPKKQ